MGSWEGVTACWGAVSEAEAPASPHPPAGPGRPGPALRQAIRALGAQTKTYTMIDEDDPILEHAEGTEIKWKQGKNLTVKVPPPPFYIYTHTCIYAVLLVCELSRKDGRAIFIRRSFQNLKANRAWNRRLDGAKQFTSFGIRKPNELLRQLSAVSPFLCKLTYIAHT